MKSYILFGIWWRGGKYSYKSGWLYLKINFNKYINKIIANINKMIVQYK